MDCDICFSNLASYKDLHGEETGNKIQILKCQNCKMLFSDVPSNTKGTSTFSHNSFKGYLDSAEYVQERIKKLLTFLESKYIDKNEHSTLLDIGCGAGWSLLAAKSMNYECLGIEPMKEAADYAVNNLNVKVINSKYQSSIINKHNDIIILDQVAEHVSAPLNFLKDVTKNLKPGGILFIAVPPNDWLRRMLSLSIQVSYKTMLSIHKSNSLILKKLLEIDLYKSPEGHINVFTEKSIKLLAINLNLEYCTQYHASKTRNSFNKLFGLSSGSYILRKRL